MSDYPKFNLRQLDNYAGRNPYIQSLVKSRAKSAEWEPTSEENEYLIRNFRCTPFSFSPMKIEIGPKSEKMLHTAFNTTKAIPEVSLDAIVAETDDLYHVKYNNHYYFLDKEEVGNLYERVYSTVGVDFDDLNSKFKYNLHPHQERAVEFFLYNKKAYLFDTVGLGKTHSSIAATIAAACKKILIICLSGNKTNWRKELECWGEKSTIIKGQKHDIRNTKKYVIINFDIVSHYHEAKKRGKKAEELYRPLQNAGFDCIIIDELHKVKHPTTKRSKVISEICACSTVEYVFGLTATAIEKSNEEFYNICRTLDVNVSDLVYTPTKYSYFQWYAKYEEFVQRYCGAFKMKLKTGRAFWRSTKNTNTHELYQRTRHIQMRRTKEQIFSDFPAIDRAVYWCELTTAQEEQASELFDNYVKAKGNKSLEEVRNMVELILLRQYLAKIKIEYTVHFVEDEIEKGNNCIIFTHFKEEFELLKKALGSKAVAVESGWNDKRKNKAIDEFMTNDKKKAILGNIIALGTGHNIQKADVVLFNSPDWNSGEHEQAEGRAHRLGRDEDVMVYHMIFEDTIEETMYNVAFSKGENKKIFYGEKD